MLTSTPSIYGSIFNSGGFFPQNITSRECMPISTENLWSKSFYTHYDLLRCLRDGIVKIQPGTECEVSVKSN